MSTNDKTVFVGLSGGVDSSVAALRLKKAGYNVVGVFIKVWHPTFLECNWETERLDAMRVAAHLDIPFLMCDAEKAYKDEVADYFISEYRAGRTPNPDVMCNKAVKFGAFLKFAKEHGADFIATGHYAQKSSSEGSDPLVYELHRGVDGNKDQSYFLWTLTQEQLASVLLPVGDTPKDIIRKEAEASNIPVASKKDSQGVCFLGHIDIAEFLSHYISLTEGPVLTEGGEIIGTHKGAFVYTVGQRHGFTINTKDTAELPHYVVRKDTDNNTLTVSTTAPVQQAGSLLTLEKCNYIAYKPKAGDTLEIQTRYRQQPITAKVASALDDSLTLELSAPHEQAHAGQSCVLYKDTQCLGGGIIAT